MSETNEKREQIEKIEKRLENLVKTQIDFQKEILQIRAELAALRESAKTPPPFDNFQPRIEEKSEIPLPIIEKPSVANEETQAQDFPNAAQSEKTNRQTYSSTIFGQTSDEKSAAKPFEIKSNLEKFIGENLISKIGIVVLVLGVAIGAKYAIDKNLISPLMRIILGYVFGFGLLGFAYKLREKYLNFSAVLLSGAMAIMYFITYFAYSLYGLFPQTTAFVLMLIFTVFTVASALLYNRVIIAQLGLVGAYAIPFLLSEDTGNYAFLFSYIAIINAGILAISIKKYWKSLHFSSFIVTWLIFSGWVLSEYTVENHFNLALWFNTIFFLTFYVTFIVYKIINLKHLALENLSLILANSFIFYGLGYAILESRAGFKGYQGSFTIAVAAIHFAFAMTVSRLKIVPQELIYLLAALVLTFLTIAVPVQLDGNFVTLIWTVEAAILFWIGRTKQIPLFEIYAYPLMFLASGSLWLDWIKVVESRDLEQISALSYPFYNGAFFTSLFFAAAFFFIYLTNRVKEFKSFLDENGLRELFGIVLAVIFLFVFYNAFRMEITNYFHFLTVTTAAPTDSYNYSRYDSSLNFFNIVWQINYTMLFLTILAFVNIARIKNFGLAVVNLLLDCLTLFAFITVGLYVLSELRSNYLFQHDAEFFARGIFHLLIRYIAYLFAAGLIYSGYLYLKKDFVQAKSEAKTMDLAFDFALFISLLFILSSELLHWLDIYGVADSYKLGLSILWGIYALGLVVLGIYRGKKHLRIGAIALFGVTLAKVFFYDISALSTISKTVVFVALGILLLIASFLYNKYKTLIFGEENEPKDD